MGEKINSKIIKEYKIFACTSCILYQICYITLLLSFLFFLLKNLLCSFYKTQSLRLAAALYFKALG